MLSGEPRLYSRFCDGIIIEAGHFLLRRRYLQRVFRQHIVGMDPRTPAFQTLPRMAIDPRTDRIRTSYLRLAAIHGGPILRRFSRLKAVSPGALTPAICRSMALRILELQETVQPNFILPPYFAFDCLESDWVEVNSRMFVAMESLANGSEVYLPIAFDHKLLGEADRMEKILVWAEKMQAARYAIWPVGLDEFRADAGELEGLAKMLRSLRGKVLMLYAGPFSVFLCALMRSSFSNGPCFYEKRDLEISPPLEFRPKCRYHLSRIHQKVDPVAAVVFYRMLKQSGLRAELCPACQRNASGDDYEGIAAMPEIDIFEHNFTARRREMVCLDSSSDPITAMSQGLQMVLDHRELFSQFRSLKFAENWIEAIERIS